MQTLHNWLRRILRKGFWVLGLPPLFLDLVAVYIPPKWIPTELSRFIEDGTNWSTTILFFSIGILISSYLVHVDMLQELIELKNRLESYESKRVRLEVGFADERRQLQKEISTPLSAIEPLNLNNIVEQKRQELLQKQSNNGVGFATAFGAYLTEQPNPDYKEEVEEYLQSYKDYIEFAYAVKENRIIAFQILVRNIGNVTARSVIVELQMPEEFKPLSRLQQRYYEMMYAGWLDEDERLPQPPEEPRPYLSIMDRMNISVPHIEPISFPGQQEVSGPEYQRNSNDRWTLTFTVARLNPQQLNDRLDGFPVLLLATDLRETWIVHTRILAEELAEPIEEDLRMSFELSN